MSWWRRSGLGRDLAVFGVGAVAAQAVSALTTPIYARVLGPTEFGIYETAMAVLSFGLALLVFSLDQGVVNRLARTTDTDQRGAYVAVAVFLPVGAAMAVGAVTLGVLGSGWLIVADETVWAMSALLLTMLIGAHVSQESLRALDLSRPFLVSVLARSLLSTAATLVLLWLWRPDALSVLAGLGIGAAVAAACNVLALGSQVRLRPSRQAASSLLRFSLPLLPSALAGWSTMLVDRVVLASDRSLADVGVYGVASRISALLLTVVYGFQTAWVVRALRTWFDDREADEQHRRHTFVVLGGALGVMAVGLSAFAPELVAIVGGPDYRGAVGLVPVLSLANACFALYVVAQIPALGLGRTRSISTIAIVVSLVNLVGNLVLVPRIGVAGAAVATLVSFALHTAMHLRLSRRLVGTPLPIGRVLTTWVLLSPLALLALLPAGPMTVAKVAVVALAALVVHRLGLLPMGELRSLFRPTGPALSGPSAATSDAGGDSGELGGDPHDVE